jgi:hypothetical protein
MVLPKLSPEDEMLLEELKDSDRYRAFWHLAAIIKGSLELDLLRYQISSGTLEGLGRLKSEVEGADKFLVRLKKEFDRISK